MHDCVSVMRTAALLLTSCLTACSPARDSAGIGAEWKLDVPLQFVESDFKTPRAALAPEAFYLAFPFIGGDLYGAPTTNDLVIVMVSSSYSFELDLTTSEPSARSAAKPVAIGEGRVRGVPASLGMARLATFTLNPETDRRVAATAWWDASSDANLVLAYFDGPGHIVGTLTEDGHEHRFNISVEKAGYVWLRRTKVAEDVSEMVVSEWPRGLVLRVAPLED